MDYHPARMHPTQTYHHQHTKSAYSAPSHVKKSVSSYSMHGDDRMAQGKTQTSPPRFYQTHQPYQPWKRHQITSSLSFMPSTSPRPEPAEYTTWQPRRPVDRGPVCISPFRSVQRMKQPFQLRLPTSPSLENIASAARESSTLCSPSSGNQSLRTWRSDQNLIATSIETFGLLPSPPLSDLRASHPSTSSAYFSSNGYSEPGQSRESPTKCDCIPGVDLCDSCSDPKFERQVETQIETDGATNVQTAHSNFVKQCESDNGLFTPIYTVSERIPSPAPSSVLEMYENETDSGSSSTTQRSRAGTESSDGSSWMPSNLSYFETWLQGVPVEALDVTDERPREMNRRKFQIVQKGPARLEELKAPDEVVMYSFAKTKPKLVDISRQSSPAMISPPQRHTPFTPDQRQQEVSAFSPDTPLEMSDSGYGTNHSSFSPSAFQDDKESEYTDSGSLSSESASETVVCERQTLKGNQPPKRNLPSTINSSSKAQSSPGGSSNLPEKEELTKKSWDHEWTIEDHEWTISQLEHSVKDYSRNMPKLTSPVIMFIRHSDEKALIRTFRKIFPDVAENLLDGLCAALVARNYIVSLATTNRRTSNVSHRATLPHLDIVPHKAGTALGMQFAHASPSRIKDRALRSRSIELRKDLDQIVEKLLVDISGRADETLKSAVAVLVQVLETKA